MKNSYKHLSVVLNSPRVVSNNTEGYTLDDLFKLDKLVRYEFDYYSGLVTKGIILSIRNTFNPQENTSLPFTNNLSTRVLEKDYYTPKRDCMINESNNLLPTSYNLIRDSSTV